MAVILAIAAGIVGVLLNQPLQIALIAAGILVGPGMLALIRSAGHLNMLADFCLAVLLFMIGLKLDLHFIRSPGRISGRPVSDKSSSRPRRDSRFVLHSGLIC